MTDGFLSQATRCAFRPLGSAKSPAVEWAWSFLRQLSLLLLVINVLGGCSCDDKGNGIIIPIDPTILETDKDHLPAWSPDGETVAYITVLYDSLAHIHMSLRTVSVATGSVSIVRELGSLIVHGLDWSPDGEWLVFSTIRGLYKVHISGDSLVQLTSGEFHSSPSWSATSDRIFFSVFGVAGINSVSPSGSDLRSWPWSDSSGVSTPSCFPKSDTLSVFTILDSGYCLALLCPEDTVITAILECGFSWLHSSRVSPDGTLIAFNAGYRGQVAPNLYLFDRADRSLEQLNTKSSEGMDFSPDGRLIVHADLGIVYAESGYADLRGTRGLRIIHLDDRTVRQLTPGYQ